MITAIWNRLSANLHILAMLRPFFPHQSELVSKENLVVRSYFYDWGRQISRDNRVLNSRIDFMQYKDNNVRKI